MISNDLKKSIFLSAFQGNLSKQNDSDTSVELLLNKIIDEKGIDSKEVKRRKIKPYDGSVPYDIPKNWKWIKLGYISDVIRGLTFSVSSKNKKENNILVLRGGNIDSKTEQLTFTDNIYVDNSIPTDAQYLTNGDILIVASSGTKTSVGKSTFIENIEKNTSFGGFMMVVRPYSSIVEPRYISYHIKMYRNKIIGDTNGYISNITNEILNNLLIPVPPIEEQRRIVDIIENSFSKINDLNLIEEKLETIKKKFPLDLKYSLINSAITAKLIENDETLPKQIMDSFENSPYEIPSNWSWVKIDDVLDIQTGLGYKKTDQCSMENGELRILRGGNINNNFQYELKEDDIFVKNINKYIELEVSDILTPSVTSMEQLGKVAYIDKKLENITAGGFVYIIRSKDFSVLNPKYAMYFINSKFHKEMCKPNINKSGQAFYNLKKSGLILQPIPIPPIKEQERIVNKLEEVLRLCNEIDNMV